MGLKAFLIEPTGALVYLRRYSRTGEGWTCAEGWHGFLRGGEFVLA